MGASGWRYSVPYQADMNRVLDDLRRDVLTRGEYDEPGVEIEILDEFGFFDADDEAREQMIAEFGLEPLRWALDRFGLDGLRSWLESQQAGLRPRPPRPRSAEELAALQCLSMSGTHSILDIQRISPDGAEGAIYPLPGAVLVSLFGTDRPTRGVVGAWQSDARSEPARDALYGRWEGFYFTVYQDGRPAEIDIEGASGD